MGQTKDNMEEDGKERERAWNKLDARIGVRWKSQWLRELQCCWQHCVMALCDTWHEYKEGDLILLDLIN